MFQPAGELVGAKIDSIPRSFLRSSPIICLIDAVFIVTKYIEFVVEERNPKLALHKFIRFRFPDDVNDEAREGSYRNLQKKFIVRLVLFLFTCPQYIKLYASSGILGPQLVTSMYLLSFVVVECFVNIPLRTARQDVGNTPRATAAYGSTSLPYVSSALATAFAFWFTASSFRDAFPQLKYTMPQWIGIITTLFGFVATFFALGTLFWVASSRQVATVPVLIWLLLTGLPVLYYLGGSLLKKLDPSGKCSTLLIMAWVSVALKYASSTIAPMRTNGHPRTIKLIEFVLTLYFFILNLGTAVLYFWASYSSVGTNRPQWTDYLG